MSAPVFLAEPGTLDGVRAGDVYRLDGAEGRHAGVVQRRGPGERVDVVDGAGVRLEGVVVAVGPDGVDLRVERRVDEPVPAVRLVLAQALAKGDRDELAIEAATELGVDTVVPWQAERSVVVWRGERAAKSRARWLGTVRAATKQSRRARVPEVEVAVDTRGLAERTRAVVASGGVVLVLHEEADDPIAGVPLPGTADAPDAQARRDEAAGGRAARPGSGGAAGAGAGAEGAGAEVVVIVGPEGGISTAEVERLVAAGARQVRLGPHVLRTSTAGPVALAVLAQRLGRWA